MKTTTPAMKILNKAYRQHLIKQAVGLHDTVPRSGGTKLTGSISPSGTAQVGGWGASSGPKLAPGAGKSEHISVPGAFMGGMWQGAKNQLGAMGSFAKGTANFVAGGLGALTATSPDASVREVAPLALNTMGAGARDMAESFGQFVGLNNAFDKNWNYVGAQAPQNVNQQRQQIQEQYFSHPQDKDLSLWHQGLNRAGDAAAETLPAALTGQAAIAGAAKIPALANAGNAVKATIEGNRVLNPVLKTVGVATGTPVHPSVLPGGSLSGWAGAAQMAQYMAPQLAAPAAGLAASRMGASPETVQQTAQTVGNAAQAVSPFLPAVAVDNVMRENIHPRAPELLDAATLPGVAKSTAPLEAFVNTLAPMQEHADQQQQQQVAEQQKQMQQNQTLADANDTYGGLLNDAIGPGIDKHFNDKINGLMAKNAPPQEINGVFDEYLQHIGKNMPVEQYEQVRQNVDQSRMRLLNMPPEQKQQAATAIQDPNSPEGQQLIENKRNEIGQAAANAAAANAPPATTPQEFGAQQNSMAQAWTNAVDGFNKMDPMMQIGMGLGLGTGVLGLLSGLGGGGIGSFLLGALGLGAAGFMGANAGMFGESGQNFADDVMLGVGSMLGMVPQVKKDDLAPLLTQNPLAELSKQAPQIDYAAAALNPEGYAKKIGPQIQQAESQLAQLEQLAGQTPYRLAKVTPGLSLEDAQLAINNAKSVLADAQNPQGQLGAQLALAREFQADPVAVRNREMQKQLGPMAANAGRVATDYIVPGGAMAVDLAGRGLQNAYDYASNFWKGSSDMNIAQRIIAEQLITKAARCWAGYEPVPGKKPYSEDSCRPVGSKKKKKKEKKAAGPVLPPALVEQYKKRLLGANSAMKKLVPPIKPVIEKKSAGPVAAAAPGAAPGNSMQYSPVPFDAQHMIQTLGMAPTTKPQMAYNRAMSLWRNNKFTPAQFSALHDKYQGLPPKFQSAPAAPSATPSTGAVQTTPAPKVAPVAMPKSQFGI